LGNKIFKSLLGTFTALVLVGLPLAAGEIDENTYSLRYIDAVGKDGSAFVSVDWEKGIIATGGPTYCDNDEPMAQCAKHMRYDFRIADNGKPLKMILEQKQDKWFGGAGDSGALEIQDFLADNEDWKFQLYEAFDLSDDLEIHIQYRRAQYSIKGRLLVVSKTTGKILEEFGVSSGVTNRIEKSPMMADGSYYLLIASTSCGASACGGGTTLYKFYP